MNTFFPDAHAIVVGVPGEGLNRSVNDAKWLYDTLIDPNVCAYDPNRVSLYCSDTRHENDISLEATKQTVLEALHAASKIPEHGSLLFYFSGHASDVPVHHLIMSGYSELTRLKGTDSALLTCGISADELKACLGKVRAKRKVVLLDCCCSAGMIELRQSWLSYGPSKRLALQDLQDLNTENGTFLLGASPHDEPAFECSPRGANGSRYSVFTYALMKAFRGQGQHRRDGVVWFSELVAYVCTEVSTLTQNNQKPIFDFSGATNFGIAYYRQPEAHSRLELPKSLSVTPDKVDAQPISSLHSNIVTVRDPDLIAVTDGTDLLPFLYPAPLISELREKCFPPPRLVYQTRDGQNLLTAEPPFERFQTRAAELLLSDAFANQYTYTPRRRRIAPMTVSWVSSTRTIEFLDTSSKRPIGKFRI